ncbi:helitron_like_N domain-containing protein [Trichonephila clavipes]|nr:helitron_like_N domain-containing protein [Trichonephila clavipes]
MIEKWVASIESLRSTSLSPLEKHQMILQVCGEGRTSRQCGECSEEVGEKGLLESRSPTFRIDSSGKDMRRTGFEGPDWGRRHKRALYAHDGRLTRVPDTHRFYDALEYPIIFWKAQEGYSFDIPQINPFTKQPIPNKKVSCKDFYAYHMMRKEVDGGVTPGSEFAFQTGGFSGRKGEKASRNGVYVRFKVDRTTSKRIRYGFITVKSTTLIGLNSPRKNTTFPAIRSVEPRRTHIPV